MDPSRQGFSLLQKKKQNPFRTFVLAAAGCFFREVLYCPRVDGILLEAFGVDQHHFLLLQVHILQDNSLLVHKKILPRTLSEDICWKKPTGNIGRQL